MLAAQPTTNPETHAAVTKVLAGVVHEGVAYEVTAQLDGVRPALSGEHPALFDPQERHLKMLAPSVAPPPVIMPYG